MVRKSRLALERLEDRCVPANWGTPWPDASHLTLSFAPDGTAVSGQGSSLFQTLGNGTAAWQREILRAFQTWAVETNINLGRVADSGDAIGANGRPQGDARFGDIRVGAAGFSSEVLIISSPYDPTAGTSSGDVRLNSSLWGAASTYDLYTAMLQEAGHTFGLGNSADTGSVMFEEYLTQRAGLGAGDVAAIQALYGTRRADAHEGSGGNNTLGSATRLGLLKNADGLLAASAEGDLGKGDRDVFAITAPSLGTLEITLERAGLSLLTPRVTVYDGAGRVVGLSVSTDPQGGDLTVRVGNLQLLGNYRIAIEGASGDVFDVGGYRLRARVVPLVSSLLGGLTTTTQTLTTPLLNNDLHTDDTFLTAGLLGGLIAGQTTATPSQFDVSHRASLSDARDVDHYRVTAGEGGVMQVMAWGVGSSRLTPTVRVFDANRNPIDAEVLVNEGGAVTLQVTGVTAGATFYVQVDAVASNGPEAVGNYFLGVDFTSHAISMTTLTQGEVGGEGSAQDGALTVERTSVFHFVLETEVEPGMAAELTILNSAGQVVGSVRANSGEAKSLTLTLGAGNYTVRVGAVSMDGRAVRPIRYRLTATVHTDPIGPQGEDPTASHSGSGSSSPQPGDGGTYYSPKDPGNSPQPNNNWYTYTPPGATSSGPGYEDGTGGSYQV